MERAFAELDYGELLAARTEIDGLIEARRQEVHDQFRSETMEKAQKLGLDLVQVLCTVEAKYRDPVNPVNTWRGKGRKPKWLQDYLDQGHDLAEYAS